MREFKFRAWENGKMYYQVRCGGVFDGIPTAPTVWNDNEGDWLNLTGQPHTVIMQYTGLKDCNGNEIYEFSEIDNEFYVCYEESRYVLRYISNNNIIKTTLYDYWRDECGKIKVTKEYSKIQEN